MSDVRHMTASVRGTEVGVSGPAEVLAELTRLASPYINILPDVGSMAAPHVQVCDVPPVGGGWRRVVLASEYEPDRVVWVDDDRRRLALVAEADDWTVQQLLRSVRYLLRWQAFERGDLFLHGGLVRAGDRGIAFLGHKRSGKTSSILSALVNGGADFVSNDDIVLTESDEALMGYGSPRTVNVRTDALLELARTVPHLSTLLGDMSHPTNAFAGRHRTVEAVRSESGTQLPGSIWVRCAELAQVTGRRLLPDSRVDVIVLPRFDSEISEPAITRLSSEEAHVAVGEYMELNATKYDPYLAAWFPRSDTDRRARLLRRLAESIPCYRLTQNMSRLAEGTSLLLNTSNVVS